MDLPPHLTRLAPLLLISNHRSGVAVPVLCAITVQICSKQTFMCVCRQLLDVQLHGSQSFSFHGRLQAAAWESYAAVTVVCVSNLIAAP